jgi:glycerol-3-phosphate acyltransferase PlsY
MGASSEVFAMRAAYSRKVYLRIIWSRIKEMSLGIFLFFIFAYLLGSIPSGKIIGLYYGIDIQKRESGNIGFANAYRVLGKAPALLVLFFDVAKGFIPPALALYLGATELQALIIGLVAVVGHVFPIWLRFNGGKGVATSLGVVLAVSPILAAAGFVLWLLIIYATKIFSVASLVAVWCIAALSFVYMRDIRASLLILALVIGITLLHKGNIGKLRQGKENHL